MAISKTELKTACKSAFGGETATDTFVSLITTKLNKLGLRLGEVYWVGKAGVAKMRGVQVCAKLYNGTEVTKRTVRLTSDFRVVLDKREALDAELGFGQSLSAPGDRNQARRQMGDFRD